ncbi:DUF5712 family protein [Pedobacter sp. KBS0701]|uniref:DUF5712 family protein n=1 Tax=Pedobacter sp. KBS0701 TaxID=2578106 RepID=UPI00352D6735
MKSFSNERWRIYVIVSRKDITNRIRLSPQNTSKGKNKEHSAKLREFNRKIQLSLLMIYRILVLFLQL